MGDFQEILKNSSSRQRQITLPEHPTEFSQFFSLRSNVLVDILLKRYIKQGTVVFNNTDCHSVYSIVKLSSMQELATFPLGNVIHYRTLEFQIPIMPISSIVKNSLYCLRISFNLSTNKSNSDSEF